MPSRISILSAAALTLLGVAGILTGARAHVVFETDDVPAEQTRKAVLRVPHRCDGQAANAVRISIPEGVVDVKPKAGWTLEVGAGLYAGTCMLAGKPVSASVREILRWKRDLPDGFYDEFAFRMRAAGDLAGRTVTIPVLQECASAKAAWTEFAAPTPVIRVQAARAAAASFRAGAIVVEAPWARATPAGAKVGGGYLTLRNTGGAADRLIGFSSPVAGRGEVHDMAVIDGVMKMREMKALDLAPGATVEFKPGGLHVMFLDLKDRLVEGKPVKARLLFEKAGELEIEFAVAPIGASGAPAGHSHH
jgi:copper(I)-binding protein